MLLKKRHLRLSGPRDRNKVLHIRFSILGHRPAPAGQEQGELGELRRKLLAFLEESKFYTVERFATYMMNKGIYFLFFWI